MPTYIETIVLNLKNKLVQVYLGDVYEEIGYTDSVRLIPAVMVGKVVGGDEDCLILDCIYVDIDGNYVFGNIHYIRGLNIKSITELNGKGSTRDSFWSADELKILGFIK